MLYVDQTIYDKILFMKNILSRCADCGEDDSILTQVSSVPEVVLLCSDCYNLKYSKEVQNEISYAEEEEN
mgnify:CR=1